MENIVSDALIETLANPPKRRVTFAEWLGKQTAERKAALEAAAKNPEWASGALTKVLQEAGAPLNHETLTKWRRELGYEQ